jgi:branched-chain amino acid transport system ATP-binding protein
MLLRVDEIYVSYSKAKALNGVSVEMDAKELVTLLGPNGAGKSTLVKTISGLLKSQAGRIEFDGGRIDNIEADVITRLGLSHCAEGQDLFIDLTVFDNLMLGAWVSRKDTKTVKDRLEKACGLFPILKERARQKAGTLSGGEQRMLKVARALMAEPKLLILDEPSLGLAPLIVEELFKIIKSINDVGVTILLVEQNAIKSLAIADRGYVLESGKVVLSGSKSELYGNEEVKRAYLGI